MKKKLAVSILSLALVATMAIGGTLAYMSATTGEKENRFIAAAGISGQIAEPKWDGKDFDGTDVAQPISPLGKELAQTYYPTLVIPKDPTLKNTSEDLDVWMAMKVTYVSNEEESAVDARDYVDTIQMDGNWELVNVKGTDSEFYLYKTTVAKENGTTTPLFNEVTIKSTLLNNYLENFKIHVSGYAVQGDLDKDKAVEELAGLAELELAE